jgi:hypothetical protein
MKIQTESKGCRPTCAGVFLLALGLGIFFIVIPWHLAPPSNYLLIIFSIPVLLFIGLSILVLRMVSTGARIGHVKLSGVILLIIGGLFWLYFSSEPNGEWTGLGQLIGYPLLVMLPIILGLFNLFPRKPKDDLHKGEKDH